jgi:hypothetical protein
MGTKGAHTLVRARRLRLVQAVVPILERPHQHHQEWMAITTAIRI